MEKITLMQELNLDGVKVRIVRNDTSKMYEVSVSVGGVEQDDMWMDWDLGLRGEAVGYAELLFEQLTEEFELVA